MSRPWWFWKHPPACTCTRCEANRLTRLQDVYGPRYYTPPSGSRRRLQQGLSPRARVTILIVAAVVALGTWAHLSARLPAPIQERTDYLQDQAEQWLSDVKGWWNDQVWRPAPQSSSPGSVAPAVISATLTPAPTATAPPSLVPSDYAQTELRLEERINEFRAGRGLSVLVHAPSLTEVARDHSEDLHVRDFFDHVNPDGLKPQDRVEAAGLLDFACGENLYQAINATTDDIEYVVSEAFTGWLNSPGHYENMIAPSHDTGAIGIYVKPTLLSFDAVPQRYSIYVTHLLCRDMAEYNRLNAEYEVAITWYDAFVATHAKLLGEFDAIEDRYASGAVPYSEVEAAFDRLETARLRLNAQVAEVNRLVDLLDAAAQ